jgi:hypothetical protein
MQFILMFDVMLIFSILCLYVLLRLTMRSQEPENHPGTWNLKSQASCAFDHFFLPTHVLINHNDLHRLILMGPNSLPLNSWVLPAIAICGFRYRDTHYSLSYFYYQLLFTVHVKIIMLIGTWSGHPVLGTYSQML